MAPRAAAHSVETMKFRTPTTLVRLAIIAGFMLLFTIGFLTPRAVAQPSPAVENAAARNAVLALTGEVANDSPWPSDFAAHLDYTPVPSGATWVKPTGDCSSPVPLPAEFTEACKEHDLGYDLLRYASVEGGQLGSWARRAIDENFDRRIHHACASVPAGRAALTCAGSAYVASVAVRANSLRQSDLTPVSEPMLPIALVVGAGCALTVGATLRSPQHARRRLFGGRRA